ncbi:MAG: FTR1 family iron permease [Candidatus Heimdallarchaeota archaeon]
MFSLASFLITMRETIEAALIIGILLAYVKKVGHRELRRDIWIGTALAILTSIGFALIFYFVLGSFEQYEEIIEGIAMILAALILTWVIIWMMRTSKDFKGKLEDKIEMSIKTEQRFGLFFLAFISVVREGIETVLFMTGVIATESDIFTIIWSSLAGIAVSIIIAVIIFWSGQNIGLKHFFTITSIFLIIFAGGMFAHGLHELQEVGWFGSESFFFQQTVWDTSYILNDKTSEIGKFLRALVGYQDKPTWLELISYVIYMVGVITAVLIITFSKSKTIQVDSSKEQIDEIENEITI